MIIHLFNSSVVSGPEQLVLPALAQMNERFMILNLREQRLEHLHKTDPLEVLSRSLGLRFSAIPVHSRWDRGAIINLRSFLEHAKPELVHAHVGKASIYLAESWRGGRRTFPVVSTHHGIRGLPNLKTRLYEFFYRRLFLKSFDRVLCVSTDDYETVRKSGIGVDKLRLHLNGMDGKRVDPDRRLEERRRIRASWAHGTEHDGLFLFGVVGRLSAEKDHGRLLRVMSILNKIGSQRDWRCLIFGSGNLETTLRARARRLGLEHRILWMGYRENVGSELAGLDLLLSFSKAEGLPINVIEAGWAATPVMCTRVGGIKDLLPDESCGQSIALAESDKKSALRLQTLLSERGRATLDFQARRLQERVAAEFSRERWMTQLRDIYSELGVSV